MSINDSRMKLRSIFSRFSASAKYRVQSSEFTHRKNHGYVGEIKAVRFFFNSFFYAGLQLPVASTWANVCYLRGRGTNFYATVLPT